MKDGEDWGGWAEAGDGGGAREGEGAKGAGLGGARAEERAEETAEERVVAWAAKVAAAGTRRAAHTPARR